MNKLTKIDGDVTRSHAAEQTDEEALAEALAALATAAANIPAPEEESVEAKRSRLELAESTAQAALDAALKRGIWENTHQARKAWKLVADDLERFESEQDRMDALSANIRERLAKIDAAQTSTATDTAPKAAVSGLPFAIPQALHRCSDQANAERLQRMYGNALISVAGNFHAWNGKRWQLDDGLAQRFACDLSRIIAHERAEYRNQLRALNADAAQGVGDQIIALTDLIKELTAWGAKCEMKSTQDAALGLLKKLLNVPVEMIDADPWLLNVENGTIDLRTGTLRPHAAADLITKLAPVAYNPTAQCPRFKQFLGEIFQSKQDVVEFLQRWYGYAATGETSEQAMLIKFGPGGNGKSTLGDVLDGVLGEYSTPATLGLLTSKSNSDTAHHAEIADLMGRRLVTASESEDGAKLKEALLKQLTGGDKLKGKRLYGQLFSFKPSHKIELLTNHKPVIKGTDFSIWRRIMLLNFPVKFGSAEEVQSGEAMAVKDTTLAAALRAELPGILTWVVEGARLWHAQKLKPPRAVLDASAEYRQEQDHVAEFLAERCTLDPAARESLPALYQAYKAWCHDAGRDFPLTRQRLMDELERRVPRFIKPNTAGRSNGVWRVGGIALTPATAAVGFGLAPPPPAT
jgi:putative DNA primase/helicase